jgi:hypothetical protein
MTQKSEFFDLLHVFLFLFVHRVVLSLLRIGTLSHCHCRRWQWTAFSRLKLTPPTASQANGSTPNLRYYPTFTPIISRVLNLFSFIIKIWHKICKVKKKKGGEL